MCTASMITRARARERDRRPTNAPDFFRRGRFVDPHADLTRRCKCACPCDFPPYTTTVAPPPPPPPHTHTYRFLPTHTLLVCARALARLRALPSRQIPSAPRHVGTPRCGVRLCLLRRGGPRCVLPVCPHRSERQDVEDRCTCRRDGACLARARARAFNLRVSADKPSVALPVRCLLRVRGGFWRGGGRTQEGCCTGPCIAYGAIFGVLYTASTLFGLCCVVPILNFAAPIHSSKRTSIRTKVRAAP